MTTEDPGMTRLLVLHSGALGDLVLTLHLIERIRRAAPCRVELASRSSWGLWAAEEGFVDQAVLLDRLGMHHLHEDGQDAPLSLREFLASFDHVLSLLGSPRQRVSVSLREMLAPRAVTCMDPRPSSQTLSAGRHVVDQWWLEWQEAKDRSGQARDPRGGPQSGGNRRGRSEGCTDSSASSEFSTIDLSAPGMGCEGSILRAGSASAAPLDAGAVVLVHPGSGGLAKCVPLEALEALVRRLGEVGLEARWMVGPDEMERFGEGLVARLRRTAAVEFELEPRRAAAVVRSAAAFVGMDAGMTHVAALLGVLTIAVFGPTDPRVWKPLGARVSVHAFPVSEPAASEWVRRLVAVLHAMLQRPTEEVGRPSCA